jgi:hypothetical protein
LKKYGRASLTWSHDHACFDCINSGRSSYVTNAASMAAHHFPGFDRRIHSALARSRCTPPA